MKFQIASIIAAAAVSGSSAFVPVSTGPRAFVAQKGLFMAEEKTPFFASATASTDKPAAAQEPEKKEMSLEDEIEELTKEEVRKMKKASNLRNANGVDYAPWMNISAEDEEKIRQVMKEKAEARRKRQLEEQSVSGALLMDSQAQELSGGGLQSKVIDESSVELSWATSAEGNTEGFLVKRRPARTEDFTVIASYKDWGPLASKGSEGGKYSFLDDTVSPGGWVYRITECEKGGRENDICQALVEVQTAEEQRGAVIAAVSIAVLMAAAIAAGALLDPVGGF